MMTDDQIAIAHLALIDAETVGEARIWQEHWEEKWDAMRQMEHHLVDEALSMVPIYRALFDLQEPS